MAGKQYVMPTSEQAQRRYRKSFHKRRRAEWADRQNWLLYLAGLIAAGLLWSIGSDLITLCHLWRTS